MVVLFFLKKKKKRRMSHVCGEQVYGSEFGRVLDTEAGKEGESERSEEGIA